MIRHTAVFRLRHAIGSTQEADFLTTILQLKTIPGVEKFELLRQISPKSEYHYGVSMEFKDHAAYKGYNEHPEHVAFVKTRWVPEVAAFTEIDYVPV